MSLNKWTILGVLATTLFAATGAYLYFYSANHPGLTSIYVGDETLYVSIADTEATRQIGLGGREKLAPDEGMLFIFPIEGKFSIWMKDMKFAIDILWVANDGSIMHIEENISPETYPATFAPETGLSRYVLEVNAGYVAAHGLEIGDKIEL